MSIFYAIVTSVLYGVQMILTMRSLAYVDPQTGSMITMGATLTVFWLLAPFMLRAEYFHNHGMWIFLANGLIHPLFSMYLSFEAAKRMGATISATISATSPLFATAGAVLFLGESLSFSLILGTLATVFGIMLLSWQGQSSSKWALRALCFPIGAAAIRGSTHNLGKFGLHMLPSPYFASLMSFSVSFLGAVLIYRFRTGRLLFRFPLKALFWNGLCGLSIAIGVLCMYTALHIGLVSVVSPIVATSPLYTFLISLLIRYEVLNVRLAFGVITVLGGIIWICL